MRRALAVAAAAAIVATAGCQATTAEAAIRVDDLAGRTVALDAPAERIVCLDGACIDVLAELDLPPVAALEPDVARDPLMFGPDVDVATIDGSFSEPDLESILAAEPDLVIGANGSHAGLAEALGDVPFYGNASYDDADAVENLLRVGTLTGREQQAQEAVERFETTIAEYAPADGELRDVTVVSMYGGTTDDIGIDAADSPIGSLLAAHTAYPWPDAGEGTGGFLEIGVDDLLDADPDHIWVMDYGAGILLEDLADDPVWGALTAVRTGQVHVTDPAWWSAISGTRARLAMLDDVLTTAYPDAFPEPISGLPR